MTTKMPDHFQRGTRSNKCSLSRPSCVKEPQSTPKMGERLTPSLDLFGHFYAERLIEKHRKTQDADMHWLQYPEMGTNHFKVFGSKGSGVAVKICGAHHLIWPVQVPKDAWFQVFTSQPATTYVVRCAIRRLVPSCSNKIREALKLAVVYCCSHSDCDMLLETSWNCGFEWTCCIEPLAEHASQLFEDVWGTAWTT